MATQSMSPYSGTPWWQQGAQPQSPQQPQQDQQQQAPQGQNWWETRRQQRQQAQGPGGYQSPYQSRTQPQTTASIYDQTQRQLATGQYPQAEPTATQRAITGPTQLSADKTTTFTGGGQQSYPQQSTSLPRPTNWDQFQAWSQVQYGKAFDTNDLINVAKAIGMRPTRIDYVNGQPKEVWEAGSFDNMTEGQWGQFQSALGQMAQQRGMTPSVGLPIPEMPTTPIPGTAEAISGGRQVTSAVGTPYQSQISAVLGRLTSENLPQAGAVGAYTTPGATTGLNQALTGQAGQLLQAGPLTGAFQAPTAVAQAERNRVLQAVLANPDVFGAQQQSQMFEQQKEQQNVLAEQARQRLSQQMAQRGLSARGGAELFGQAGIEENLLSGLLGAQRDIALRAAEQNRAARLQAVEAATQAQQADLEMATRAYQTGLAGAQANREAQLAAMRSAGEISQSQADQARQAYEANLAGYQANLAGMGFNTETQQNLLQQLANMQTTGIDQSRANMALALQAQMAQRQQQLAEYERMFGNVFDYNKWLQDSAAELRRLAMEEAQTRYNVSRPY